jgi:hypothetical protein
MPLEARRSWVLASAAIAKGYVILGKEAYTLGRGQDCLIPLNSTNVSRKHCEVAWGKAGPGYWISDLGSTNGTVVNGQAVTEPRRLDHDDTISVGNVVIRFLCVEGGKDELARRFDPRTEETNKIATSGPDALVSGKIARSVLQEVCQLIELNRRSGELHVRCSGLHGVLRFKDGIIVDARSGNETGEKIARRLLAFTSGEYAFGGGGAPKEGPLKLRALALLMDLARVEDELAKTRDAAKTRRLPRPGLRPSDPDEESTGRI